MAAHKHAAERNHPGHNHSVSTDADQKRLAVALGLILTFMVGEVVAGLVSSSLALLSDAGHMLTDAGALGLSLMAMRWTKLPPRGRFTFGFKRTEILAAQANGLTLWLIAVVITVEAIRRLISPPQVTGFTVLAVGLAGILVNLLATWQISNANRQSLNVEGSFQHILTDLYAFIGTAIAGVVILVAGFDRADPIASLVVVALMLRAGYGLLKQSGRVFLEAAPAGLEPVEVIESIKKDPAVTEVHDFHLWEVTSGFPALSAHVLVRPEADCHEVRRALEATLKERFEITHTTLQTDHDQGARLLNVEGPGSSYSS